jgi:hypothetical protein
LPKIKLSDISDVKYAYAINALKNDWFIFIKLMT